MIRHASKHSVSVCYYWKYQEPYIHYVIEQLRQHFKTSFSMNDYVKYENLLYQNVFIWGGKITKKTIKMDLTDML